jgi:hypothetical protein
MGSELMNLKVTEEIPTPKVGISCDDKEFNSETIRKEV